MFFIIGLGLSDEKDISVKGLEAIKSCKKVFLEAYTSILMVDKEKLEYFYEKRIEIADREMVESMSDEILKDARDHNVAFLVVGDPFGATTHSDLALRAKEMDIDVKVIHNASVMNAIGVCGLQLYNYGHTVSIPFFTETWKPQSFYDRIKRNKEMGLHTLCLLDIKVKEQSLENLVRGRKIYEPPRYMTVNCAVEQLLEVESSRNENVCSLENIAIGVARLGSDDQFIRVGKMKDLLNVDFGNPLHCLIIPADEIHYLEEQYMNTFF